MKVLVIGGGGREHAIAKAIARSPKHPEIYAVMAKQNPGIARLCKDFLLEKETNVKWVVDYATANKIDIAIIGPEAPLAAGLANSLEDAGIPVAGPKKEVACIEFDKAWARDFMNDNNIDGCPAYRVFSSDEGLKEFIAELKDVAVKPAGLTGGKGVRIMGDQLTDTNEAYEYAKELLENDSVVIEENLKGEEFTLQAFVDGENLAFAPCVQDHKRAFENDLGPNTGGMGAYSDVDVILPFMVAEDLETGKKIMKQTVKALKSVTGVGYKGILYGQFILTKAGPKVIEFNARFGDPEAMNVLPLLETDMTDVIDAIANGKLGDLEVKFAKKATVCKYVVPAGYPDNPDADKEVIFGDMGDAILFYSSVYEMNGKIYTTSSRSAAVVAVADSIKKAELLAQEGIENIIGDLHYRSDIGTEALIAKKVNHMKEIRGY
ncbi:phosphoribosylamine--glycine ligase [Methanohalophilus levihalophilus]|uniref:phosphoribosylamine--glycine ligase n=1 Tax=Methanohalophilus levihalophilus TaxID=1431282 RepID=UPI001AEB142D|nr:phosphoribosylamine--glycine ligase [Methanohalophilus levihalophilus]MBP2029118.1 phosphoribosylamine--glycine ligase [Methanohalophilus levihalophilus]